MIKHREHVNHNNKPCFSYVRHTSTIHVHYVETHNKDPPLQIRALTFFITVPEEIHGCRIKTGRTSLSSSTAVQPQSKISRLLIPTEYLNSRNLGSGMRSKLYNFNFINIFLTICHCEIYTSNIFPNIQLPRLTL